METTSLQVHLEGKYFYLSRTNKQSNSLQTLLKIERVLKEKREYFPGKWDEFSELSSHKHFEILKKEAEQIQEDHTKKTQSLSTFKKWIKRTDRKEKKIAEVYNRIITLLTSSVSPLSPPMLGKAQPDAILDMIMGHLTPKDLANLGAVNKESRNKVLTLEMQVAHAYGYSGSDPIEANQHILHLCNALEHLIKKECIPLEYCITVKRKNKSYICLRSTLKNIFSLEEEKKKTFLEALNKALFSCAAKGDVFGCQSLIKLGADVHVQSKTHLETPLHWAAAKNHTKVIELLIRHKVNVNAINGRGQTPLLVAAKSSSTEAVKALLKATPDLSISDNQKQTPLCSALSRRDSSIIHLLLAHGRSKEYPGNLGKSLGAALRYGYNKIAEIILEKELGDDINHKDSYGNTALHYANRTSDFSDSRHKKLVKGLIERGADIETKNIYGQTPLGKGRGLLQWAVEHNYQDIIKEILENKDCMDINYQDETGCTALHLALSKNNQKFLTINDQDLKIARLLIEHGADVNCTNLSNETPLSIIFRQWLVGRISFKVMRPLITLLLKKGANPNAVTNYHNDTMLHILVQYSVDVDFLKLLVESGIDPNARNSRDRRALDLVEFWNKKAKAYLKQITHP